MVDVSTLCPKCMKDRSDNAVCPHCGFDANSYEAPLHHLAPGTILNGKYWTGIALGEGGFGITYIGWDINFELKVAIKEYFPNGFVSRDVSNTDTITIFSGNDQNVFLAGKEKFFNEAKLLAKFDNQSGIVSVKDFFFENGTAYIVMEYLDGETLKQFLKRNGGKCDPESIFAMMQPLMYSLNQVHKAGLIHRDISPDNIMILSDSTVKLLDFGAARDISADGQKSLSIQLKPGYAPEEQYRSHGKQGPWTDIYALCATMYRAITGTQPVESLERLQNDTLVPPSQLGIKIDPMKEAALMHGLAVFANQRIQDIDILYNALYSNTYTPPAQNPNFTQQPTLQNPYNQYNKQSKLPIILTSVIGGLFVIAAIVVLLVVLISSNSEKNISDSIPGGLVTESPTTAPTNIPAPIFTMVLASSTRGTDTEGGQYSKEAVLSEDPMTKWVPSKRSTNGIGEWIQLSSNTPQYVSGIKILNGYHKSAETWAKNNRVCQCTITFSTGESRVFTLSDTMDMIFLDFGKIIETTSINLTINSVYSGSKWNDTAITYFGVY